MKHQRTALVALPTLLSLLLLVPAEAESPKSETKDSRPSAERGRKALQERAFTPPMFSLNAYQNVWKQWGEKKRPEDFDQKFRERYGLHPAPFPNKDYPLGLRESTFVFMTGLATDCMVCHGGSIFGKSYVGLGNSTLDFEAFMQEMTQAEGKKYKGPFQSCRVRGTVEAGAMATFLLGLRNPDLSVRSELIDLDLHDDLCEDVPAWWLLKKKKTMYHNGWGNARSVRSLMQFMMSPLNLPHVFKKEEKTFRDIQAYLLTLEAPKYPLAINKPLAAQGEKLFTKHCSRCHGTYGEEWSYPNRIVPLDVIGTDQTRYNGISKKFTDYYNKTWFAKEQGGGHPGNVRAGYQAPPLDGVWATAPYFHNGSVPTVYNVLNSKSRPKIFTRSYRTAKEDYDAKKLGWKVKVLEKGANNKMPALEQRKIYDTTQNGRGNQGHTFGDKLTEKERMAVIEYLKTL